jgi:hypothetical protein
MLGSETSVLIYLVPPYFFKQPHIVSLLNSKISKLLQYLGRISAKMNDPNQTAPVDVQNQIRDTTKDNKNEITPVKSEADGEILEKSDQDHTDIGYGFYQESLEMDPVEREMLAKRVKKKLDFILLPMVSSLRF